MADPVAILNNLASIATSLPDYNPSAPLYAIYQSDTFIPLVLPTTWAEVSERSEQTVSDYPNLFGGFTAYNKVTRPSALTITIVKSGTDLARYTWKRSIDQQIARNPTQLYTILTPEGVYEKYTVTGRSKSTRPERGSHQLYLTLNFVEIQQIPSLTGVYENVLEPKSSPISDIGQVYTSVVDDALAAQINLFSFF